MENILKTLIVLFSLLVHVGCKKFLDIPPPKNQLVTESVFDQNETAVSALTNIYSNMFGSIPSPYRLALATGLAGDELENFSPVTDIVQIYQNAVLPNAQGTVEGIWKSAYNYIYRANAVYEGCENSKKLDSDIRKQLMGEALFIRAYWYFYLVNLFGDVPLITTTDYEVNATQPRASVGKVYEQIIHDLEMSKNNLSEGYIHENAALQGNERNRPNRFAASGLLARVYLYLNKYTDAEMESSDVINQKDLYKVVPLDEVFLKNNNEALFQLSGTTPNLSNINTTEGFNFILIAAPQIGGKVAISEDLMDSFEDNDKRKVDWVRGFVDSNISPAKIYYYPYKYKIRTGDDFIEYSTVLRLAEQYLIRAEARAQLGKLASSVDDLDVVRVRAGLPAMKISNTTIDKQRLIDAIYHERRIEFFAEQGHRWFDLKRSGMISNVMGEISLKKGSTWTAPMQWWPIPQVEILNNPNLKQNVGYN